MRRDLDGVGQAGVDLAIQLEEIDLERHGRREGDASPVPGRVEVVCTGPCSIVREYTGSDSDCLRNGGDASARQLSHDRDDPDGIGGQSTTNALPTANDAFYLVV